MVTVCHLEVCQVLHGHCLPSGGLSSVPWSLFAIWRFVKCSMVTVCHLEVFQVFHGHCLPSRGLWSIPWHCLPSRGLLSIPWSLFAIWRFVEYSMVTVCHLEVCQVFHGHCLPSGGLSSIPWSLFAI